MGPEITRKITWSDMLLSTVGGCLFQGIRLHPGQTVLEMIVGYSRAASISAIGLGADGECRQDTAGYLVTRRMLHPSDRPGSDIPKNIRHPFYVRGLAQPFRTLRRNCRSFQMTSPA
jgi:hypothetical protein